MGLWINCYHSKDHRRQNIEVPLVSMDYSHRGTCSGPVWEQKHSFMLYVPVLIAIRYYYWCILGQDLMYFLYVSTTLFVWFFIFHCVTTWKEPWNVTTIIVVGSCQYPTLLCPHSDLFVGSRFHRPCPEDMRHVFQPYYLSRCLVIRYYNQYPSFWIQR